MHVPDVVPGVSGRVLWSGLAATSSSALVLNVLSFECFEPFAATFGKICGASRIQFDLRQKIAHSPPSPFGFAEPNAAKIKGAIAQPIGKVATSTNQNTGH